MDFAPAAPASVFTRRVEGLVAFWCSDNGIEKDVQQRIAGHYGSIEVLEGYIRAYTQWDMFDTLWDRDNRPQRVELFEIMDELLAFPYRMGMDPMDPETVEWAKFFVPYRAGGTYARRERLNWKGVAKLWKARVPLEYARALDTPTWDKQMPVQRVIRLYREGVPIEYARELLYGAKA